MKKLLIINKKIKFSEKSFFLTQLNTKNLIILDINFEQNIEFYQKLNIINYIYRYNIFFEKNFQKIKLSYEKKISIFLKENPKYIIFKFSEINFSDFWWKLTFNVKAINIFCKKNKVNEIQVLETTNSYLSEALFFQNDKKYFIKNKYNFNLFIYKIFLKKIFYLNFIKEIYTIFCARRLLSKNHNKKNKIIYSSFPYGWIFSKKTYSRFFGNEINNDNNFYLFSITRNNKYQIDITNNLINKLKKIKNYFILESYGSIKNILKSYFFLPNNKKAIFDELNNLFNNKYIAKLLTYGIVYVEKPKNKVFENNLNQFYKQNKINKILHNMPEFIDGRIINKTFNYYDVSTYSLQHSSIGDLQFSRFISMLKILDKINKNYLSKKIFVENNIIKKNLKNISPIIKIVGNIRINKRKFVIKINERNIFYISEMHNVKLLKDKIKEILNNFKEKNLFIRVHPGKKVIQKKIILQFKEYNKRLFIDKSKSISKSITTIKPILVLTSSPTIYSELITNNQKTVLLKDNSFITNYPSEIKKNKVITTEKFKSIDFQKKIHKVPTTIYGIEAERKIIKYFNE